MDMAIGAVGDGIVSLVKERVRGLSVPEDAREEAVGIVRSRGRYGMEEPRLHSEWVNDVLADMPAEGPSGYDKARRDPGASYLAWVAVRVQDPFKVSFRSVRALVASSGEENANAIIHVRWRQEIAWAKRLRSSSDPRTAVHALSFLVLAARDPGKAFIDLAAAWGAALAEPGFALRPEHDLDEDAIRFGPADVDHKPVFLRMLAVRNGPSMDRTPADQVAAAARRARLEDEREVARHLGARAVASARRTPLSRLTGIIDVAIETGRCSDGLVADEDAFLAEVSEGRILVSGGGVPYAEFVSWLRAGGVPSAPEPVPPGSPSHGELAHLQFRPRAWLAKLPGDYAALGGDDAKTLNSWLTPIALGRRPMPRDLVVDYGFHLVGAAFRR